MYLIMMTSGDWILEQTNNLTDSVLLLLWS